MKFYVKNKETGDRYLVLASSCDESGSTCFIIASLKAKIMLKVTAEHFVKNFLFDGLVD